MMRSTFTLATFLPLLLFVQLASSLPSNDFVEFSQALLKQDSNSSANGVLYERFSHPSFAGYSLRLRSPKLCDPSVLQYSGYLDIADNKHIFFWFFESRSSPEDDPLVMWLNGGPGCSSTTGLLFELGPCTINEDANSTTYNPHSWNSNANIFFLDQPVDVGYSYADGGATPVGTSPVAAADVYAFLQLFFQRFSKYAKLPFHIAAESYGGLYAPNIASVIHKENKQLIYAPSSGKKKINLMSVMLGNGLTDPLIQMPSVVDYLCEGPFTILDPNSRECRSLHRRASTCARLINSCYKYDVRTTCTPAALYCWEAMFGPLAKLGVNVYDHRLKCDQEKDGPQCYKELAWIDTYMNQPHVQTALGVAQDRHFESCNLVVHTAFLLSGDGMRNGKSLLTNLVNDGIRLLVYAGNVDLVCNYMGEEKWISQFESKFLAEFTARPPSPWRTLQSDRLAGVVRSAGGDGVTAGNVTFVTVYEAGHMVPHDQPEAALDMLNRWIWNIPLEKSL